jgi:predicted nucleic acid-binding Zn ribbon protein
LATEGATGIRDVLNRYLRRTGLGTHLDRASVVDEWPALVGPQIAGVTAPEGVTADGVLFVRVRSAAWLQELQMMSPEILRKLGTHRKKIRRIVWRMG